MWCVKKLLQSKIKWFIKTEQRENYIIKILF